MAVADQDDFSTISWHSQNGPPPPKDTDATEAGNAPTARPEMASSPSIGRDDASFSEQLECTVSSPVKENDGSKDSFVSYLITTQV